jgi:hypothetical protein
MVSLIVIDTPETSYSLKKIPGTNLITSSDLESYLTFLASPLLKGRKNGEPGLDIAQQYIVSEAKLLGLRPANGKSYLQPYSVIKSTTFRYSSLQPGFIRINIHQVMSLIRLILIKWSLFPEQCTR